MVLGPGVIAMIQLNVKNESTILHLITCCICNKDNTTMLYLQQRFVILKP